MPSTTYIILISFHFDYDILDLCWCLGYNVITHRRRIKAGQIYKITKYVKG